MRWSSTRRCSSAASSAEKTTTAWSSRWPTWCWPPGQTGSPELASELQDFVRGRLAEYKRPRWVEFVAELPEDGDGQDAALQVAATGVSGVLLTFPNDYVWYS